MTASHALLLTGTLLTDGTTVRDGAVAVMDGRIAYAGPRAGLDSVALPSLRELELPPGSLLLPGLVDLHCHGAAGGDFPGGDAAAARAAVEFLHRSGTTTLLASLVTAPREDLVQTAKTLRVLAAEGLIAGLHAEGPFLSHARCGAQDPRFLLDPDPVLLGELAGAAGGHLRTMTYAPELSGAAGLVQALVAHGVVPSLGHTDADTRTTADSLTEAADLLAASGPGGARPTVTHLFNGMPPLHHRSPGPVGACLRLAAAGRVAVELVADGVHLDPETVRMVFALAGAANVALVTDSMAATGLPDGEYELGPAGVVVRDGEARLRGSGALAGGTATLLDVVRRTIAAGVDAAEAVLSATAVPAAVLGLGAEVGSLRTGLRADVVVVDHNFRPVLVIRRGEVLA
ncbi:N-acetylglucosamine 6-phosphate deacetylase [Pseudarthrobacter enclensis]|uniref:N-acetylglucosamine-6-phosphate deacetylase n=1 Tax=Pseudarthrobacter enclensis TaxID=993070 RepID=A0A0V8IPR7_9MICC|nr:N-acetylglucosamine-6-phosphate deacetylase [Pseudarthrobacter enclensis]KSU76700.1 N-acetylglucosamine-6-phosphate deacetylase [Pseudarthrobacter enclensis]SCC01273.1 N-acetylglucosamine 6-phosphate deacetylase [Pseudarthrobacter enclensis]